MRSNIDHSAIINKGKSIALAIQVDDFLKAQGKSQPTQIPFGHSERANRRAEYGHDAQATMREIMFNSVRETKIDKSKPKPIRETFESAEQKRRELNRSARLKAWGEGKKTFKGSCAHHGQQTFCIKANGQEHICKICRDQHSQKQTIKRRKKQVAA